MKKENGRAEMRAATLGNGFQQSVKWVDYELEKVLLASALIGIGASLAIAYVIIFLSTGSSLLTTMAVGTIGCTVATLIATLVWIGWEMSLLESICLTILVGLSVDYTIHLANAWGNSKATTRLEKTQHMLGEIGISVFAASITTFLSAVALFACTVLFFFKFGVFIALTIIISMVYAFLLFTALVALVGPLCTEADWTRIHRCMTGGEGPTAGGSAAGKGAINPNPAKHLSAL
jgi:predicted RND superfamily exporter protein